ncbi:MAG: alpha/beta fold hydrolase [Eubacteriales bacterium]|nr:alpha/beta fold hydrolase [Eubacteriales bacterium]
MKKKEDHKEDARGKTTASKIGRGIQDAAGLALFTGACVGAGALAGAAGHFYKKALVPQKQDPSYDPDPALKDYEEGRRWAETHPLREEVYLRADDGLQLHAAFIPAIRFSAGAAEKRPAGDAAQTAAENKSGSSGDHEESTQAGTEQEEHRYAVCVHGWGGISDGMGLYARVYRDRLGMHVLLPDLRGFGRSDGDYVGMGYDDSRDLLRWIDWIIERDPAAQIVLHGISMGAAAVLMTTGYTLPAQVAAAVSDSSYTSAEAVLKAVYRSSGGAVFPAPVMYEAVRGIALLRAGYDLAKASPVRAVSRSRTPTLFIHGQADTLVSPGMMPALYKAAACRKAFLWIPEAFHAQAVVVDPETYWGRVEKFLHAQGISIE